MMSVAGYRSVGTLLRIRLGPTNQCCAVGELFQNRQARLPASSAPLAKFVHFRSLPVLWNSFRLRRHLPFRIPYRRLLCGTMSAASFESIPTVKLDNGRFKYILIKVHDKNDDSRTKLIVRGSAGAAYHSDIFDSESAKIEAIEGLELECLGGGRIIHNPDRKEIKVFGYSQGYGQADHSKTVEILKNFYPNYDSITFSNEGY
ncbi:unnamed protein product [Ixodes persulcatus]